MERKENFNLVGKLYKNIQNSKLLSYSRSSLNIKNLKRNSLILINENPPTNLFTFKKLFALQFFKKTALSW